MKCPVNVGDIILLIVPFWNWNITGKRNTLYGALTSNRTILELKCFIWLWQWYETCRLLIVPFWNWNKRLPDQDHYNFSPSNRTILELKSRSLWPPNKSQNASNRTILELKYRNRSVLYSYNFSSNRTILELKWNVWSSWRWYNRLLIVPFWNWNFFGNDFLLPCFCSSNRTILELKYRNTNAITGDWQSSNRTILELKLQFTFDIFKNTFF